MAGGKQIELFNHTRDIAQAIRETHDLKLSVAEEIVEEVFNAMKDIVLAQGVVGVKNFGSFKVRHQANMQFYDFKKEEVRKVARNVLVFYPSANMKDLINIIDLKKVVEERQSKRKKQEP